MVVLVVVDVTVVVDEATLVVVVGEVAAVVAPHEDNAKSPATHEAPSTKFLKRLRINAPPARTTQFSIATGQSTHAFPLLEVMDALTSGESAQGLPGLSRDGSRPSRGANLSDIYVGHAVSCCGTMGDLMHRRLTYLPLATAFVALISIVAPLGVSSSPLIAGAAGTTTTTSTTTTSTTTTTTTTSTTTTTVVTSPPVTGFYIDIGGSASLGFQPDGVPHHNGHRTLDGYANDIKLLEASSITLNLRELGCPGETVQSMLGLVANVCYHLPITQLSRAVDALISDGNEQGIVTIDLGFNNIRACLLVKGVNQNCVNQGINYVYHDLPKILKILQGAAGPNVHFVGLEYSDPFLGYYLNGTTGPAVAAATLTAMNRLNATLAHAYNAAGIAVANVPGSYKNDNTTPENMANVGKIPENVAVECQWTWMCTPPPFGPDDHPNNAGYMIIARDIIATLPTTW